MILLNMGRKKFVCEPRLRKCNYTLVKKCPLESYFEKYGLPLCTDDKFPCTLVFEKPFLGEFCQ
jgi:hypothetical protein